MPAKKPAKVPADDEEDEHRWKQLLVAALERMVRLLDRLAAFVLETLTEPLDALLRKAQTTSVVLGVAFGALGVFALFFPDAFLEALPYLMGALFVGLSVLAMLMARRFGTARRRTKQVVKAARVWTLKREWDRD